MRAIRVVLPLLFVGSCAALLPVGMRLTDPMTRRSVDSVSGARFPVVVMAGGNARVQWIDDLRHVPPLPAGSSYLIPSGKDDAVETQLNARSPARSEGRWVLDVRRLARDRQHIELFWMNDGYSGGGYEATRLSVMPRYRKITGPGYAFEVCGAAFLINVALWAAVLLPLMWWRRRARSLIVSSR